MTPWPVLTRPLAVVLALAILAGGATAVARDAAVTQMRDLLARGYYNSAAQLNGPNLVQQFPDDPEAHLLYARALYFVGDLAGAAARLAIATDLVGSGVPADHAHLGGLIRAAQGDAAGALRPLQNAFLRTRSYEYAMDWARVAWQAGLYEEAIEAYEAASGTDRGRTEPWPSLGRGRLLAALERTDEAIAAFLHAIMVFEANDPGGPLPSPAYVEAYFRLGEAYEELGQPTSAEASYKSARTADPNFGPAVRALDRLSRRVD
jgi:tetratricopeptide (TPR) repeat protein